MGLFDVFKGKKKEESAAPAPAAEEVSSVGWDAITAEFDRLYPGQEDPKHYGTLIAWRLGGKDPLDGISIYDDGDCWHFVTYGLSELYEKETDDMEYSGYGMEFTLRLKKADHGDPEKEERELKGICGILQTIARITFEQGEIFQPFEYLYTGQKTGMDVEQKSMITGFITVPDVKAQPLDTPNGKVEFVEFIGATDQELLAVKEKRISVKELYEKIGSDVTDYNRAEAAL